MKQYLNIIEAAKYCGLSIGTLRVYTWQGKIPQINFAGAKKVRYSKEVLDNYLATKIDHRKKQQ